MTPMAGGFESRADERTYFVSYTEVQAARQTCAVCGGTCGPQVHALSGTYVRAFCPGCDGFGDLIVDTDAEAALASKGVPRRRPFPLWSNP